MTASHTSTMLREWERFVAGDDANLATVDPVVRESWLRCREKGVDPGQNAAPIVLAKHEIEELRRATLLDAAAPTLEFMRAAIEGHRVVVILADAQCRPLEIFGDPRAVRRAEGINCVVGSQWLEHQVGTDAMTLCCQLNMAVQTRWFEHYCALGHRWAGSAAPIRDPFTRELIGAATLYGYEEVTHPRAFELVLHSARLIERELYKHQLAQRLVLFEQYNARLRGPDDALLCGDDKGRILVASPGALRLLGIPSEYAVGRLMSQLPKLYSDERMGSLELPGLPTPMPANRDTTDRVRVGLELVNNDRRFAGFIAHLAGPASSARRTPAATPWRATFGFSDIRGASAALRTAVERAQRIAEHDLPALLIGESGTGKELFAHAIHQASERAAGPFVPLNCGGLGEELLMAELFGYAEGAFTGAARGGMAGKLELADGGTLFLDEVQDMSPKMQVALLRVLEEGRLVRMGSEKPKRIDVRIIAAAQSDPGDAGSGATLRPDLYYRLSALKLVLPPLRERHGDVAVLAPVLLAASGVHKSFTDGALARLAAAPWPGNVRQLRNVVVQAADATDGDVIDVDAVAALVGTPAAATPAANAPNEPVTPELSLQRAEKDAIVAALAAANGHVADAAARLGIHRVSLYRMMRRHGIRPS
jgi:sigma-54 dependent transcriptional regulator, acetoin dehydrogenase operon transcriptional activator AcoR